jgi:hypothetical protein
MGLRPTQGDEKRLLFSNYSPWKHRSPLCHLDRSATEWRDLRFSGPFLAEFPLSTKKENVSWFSLLSILFLGRAFAGGAWFLFPTCG